MLHSIIGTERCSASKMLLAKYQLKLMKDKFYSLLPTTLVKKIQQKERQTFLEELGEGERFNPWMRVVLQFEDEIR